MKYVSVSLFRSRWCSWTVSLRIVCIGHVDWQCPERRSWQVLRAPSAPSHRTMSSFTCSGWFVICTRWKPSTTFWMWDDLWISLWRDAYWSSIWRSLFFLWCLDASLPFFIWLEWDTGVQCYRFDISCLFFR